MSKTKQKNHIVSISNQGRTIQFLLAKEKTNIIEQSQLEELTKEHELYLPIDEYVYDEEVIQLNYSLNDEYKLISEANVQDEHMVKQIVKQLAKMEDMLGTQYTPFIDMENVFINQVGEIKFAFRGLRMVTTQEEITPKDVFLDSKKLMVQVLTLNFPTEQQTIAKVKGSKNFNELVERVDELGRSKPVEKQGQPIKQTNPTVANKQPDDSNRKNMIVFGCIGLIIGLLSMYFLQVMPLTKEVEAKQQEIAKHVKAMKGSDTNLQKKDKQIEQAENKQSALLFALKNEPEKAISLLEKMDGLNEEYEAILLDQYIKLDTVDSLSKALKMKAIGNKDLSVIEKLLAKQEEAANKIVLSYKSENPAILVEQAYLSKKFDDVIKLSKENKDNERISYLAAESYLQKKNPDEALKIAKQIKNKQLQINSLTLKKDLVQQNKKLKKEDKEKQVKKIDEEIKKLG